VGGRRAPGQTSRARAPAHGRLQGHETIAVPEAFKKEALSQTVKFERNCHLAEPPSDASPGGLIRTHRAVGADSEDAPIRPYDSEICLYKRKTKPDPVRRHPKDAFRGVGVSRHQAQRKAWERAPFKRPSKASAREKQQALNRSGPMKPDRPPSDAAGAVSRAAAAAVRRCRRPPLWQLRLRGGGGRFGLNRGNRRRRDVRGRAAAARCAIGRRTWIRQGTRCRRCAMRVQVRPRLRCGRGNQATNGGETMRAASAAASALAPPAAASPASDHPLAAAAAPAPPTGADRLRAPSPLCLCHTTCNHHGHCAVVATRKG